MRTFLVLLCLSLMLSTSYANNAITIKDDRGGGYVEYVKRAMVYEETGTILKFDGYCLSACTILTMPTFEIIRCMSKDAKFGFHQPYYIDPTDEERKDAVIATKAMWNSYHPKIRAYLSEHGWPSVMKGADVDDLTWMNAQDMEGVIPYCD